MKKAFAIPLFLVMPLILLNAQTRDANLSFDFLVHDFGKIQEAKGPVTVNFQFTNTGSQPLLIKQVHASCGCTSPEWSREPVLPGKTGFVSATYNPKSRPGPFNKTITVTSNAANPTVVLTIKGDVEPKPQTLEDIYRYNMGNKIRLMTASGRPMRSPKVIATVYWPTSAGVNKNPISKMSNRYRANFTSVAIARG